MTGRTGAAAKAGHDLVILVTSWEATLVLGEDPAQATIELSADATSLRVQEGSGGMKALGENDKTSIQKAIDDDVLKRKDITFRSTEVHGAAGEDRLSVQGELTLMGKAQPVTFDLDIADDGTIAGTAVVPQTAWGMKPYSTMLGALKVADDVRVAVDGRL
ncbi:MAG: YceI family protein [Thermoleophilaceae bacterium]